MTSQLRTMPGCMAISSESTGTSAGPTAFFRQDAGKTASKVRNGAGNAIFKCEIYRFSCRIHKILQIFINFVLVIKNAECRMIIPIQNP